MKARTQNRLSAGLALALLAFVILVQSIEPAGTQEATDPSLANYEDPGRRAAYLLLQQLGFRARPWQLPPSSLPRDGALLVMPDVPRSVLGRDSSSDLPVSPLAERTQDASSLDIHLPVHYRRFLESGGVIFASAESGMQDFLAEELELAEVAELVLAPSSSEETVLPTGDTLEIECSQEFELVLPESFSVFAAGIDGAAQVISLEVGRGELVLFADESLLSNSALREGDEGLLLVRAVEEFSRSGQILFDEYSLGRWNPMTQSELVLSDRFLQLTVQFLCLVAFFVWRLGWIGRFPRDPEPFELLSPLSRVRSQAYLIERAGRYDILGRWLVEGVVKRVMKTWRLLPGRQQEDGAVEANLLELGKRAGVDGDRWREKLCEAQVANPASLASLEGSLMEFEREVMGTHSARKSRRN